MLKKITLVIFSCFLFIAAKGQTTILIRHANKDTAFIREYYHKRLIIRAYESTKFNNFKLIDEPNKLVYKPNDHNNIGVGFNYKFIDINLGFYVPFIDKDRNTYGKTHDLDLQTHLYLHKFIVDIYGQFYRGYYLSNGGAILPNYHQDNVLIRPDISTRDISISVQYVFNDKKFSYNAPFYQNERQKKSAGSFLLGGGIYHFDAKADSAFAPANIAYNDFFRNYRFNNTSNNAVGFNVGYAYTLVFKKFFFITASLSGGGGINYASLTDTQSDEDDSKFGLELNLNEKFAAGYNSDNYFVGVSYVRLVTEDNGVIPHTWQEVNSGNFRFNVAKRFRLKKTLIPKTDLIEIE